MASVATGRLESSYKSYVFNGVNTSYNMLTTNASYYATYETEEARNRSMNLNKSGGEKTAISIYYSWRFNKDE